MQNVGMLKLLTGTALAGFIVIGGAQAQSSGQMQSSGPNPPQQAGTTGAYDNPGYETGKSNCGPQNKTCANYPTGDTVKDNSTQYLSPQDMQQQKAPQQQSK